MKVKTYKEPMICKYLGSDLSCSSNLGCNILIFVARTQRLGLTFAGKSWVGRVETFPRNLWSYSLITITTVGAAENFDTATHSPPNPLSLLSLFFTCLVPWGYLKNTISSKCFCKSFLWKEKENQIKCPNPSLSESQSFLNKVPPAERLKPLKL